MSIIIKDLSYIHADKEVLFEHLNFTMNSRDKMALIGNNGCGKSTLLQILAGVIMPTSGTIIRPEQLYYVPQHFGQYDHQSIAQALGIDNKLNALQAILTGDAHERNFATLSDDWTVEERTHAALSTWGMNDISLTRTMCGLSGGEKTRIFLAGIELHNPTVIFLDEPTNHLDTWARQRLYSFIHRTSATVLVTSHDRTLLNRLSAICELSKQGLMYYSGNYDFYKEQKALLANALQQQLEERQKTLRLVQRMAREAEERKTKQNVRGEKLAIKKGIPRIVMGAMKQNSEQSTNKLHQVHTDKQEKLQQEMTQIRSVLPLTEQLKTNFNASALHTGKVLITAKEINFRFPDAHSHLWKTPLNFELRSGDRLCIKGKNGSGKTTLLKLITGEWMPTQGVMERADFSFVYLDQEYSMVNNVLSVWQQADSFNHRCLPDHEVKAILNRYLFPHEVWEKLCSQLSGGEKMRLCFCCLMLAHNTPDLFLLDEPTNNLDIESIGIITTTIRRYEGTVIVISHDPDFLQETAVEQEIALLTI